MATASGPFSTYPSLLSLRGVCYQISTNIAANTSVLRIDVYVDFSGGSASTSGGSFTATIAGNSKGFTWGYTSIGAGSTYVGTHDVTVGHNANGSASAGFSVSASFPGGGNWGTASGSGTISSPSEITDFDFTAGIPSSMTAVYTPGVGVNVSWAASVSYITPVTYYHSYRSSTDGGVNYGSWSSETSTTSLSADYNSLTPGLTYQFRVRAFNGQDNYSGYRESNTIFLTAGGKRYAGPNPLTDWILTAAQAKRWNGSAWVSLGTLKRFDGSNWVNLS